VTFKDGVVFGAKKREAALIKPGDKIFQIDDHIATAASGMVGDARVLVDEARVKAQQNKVVFDEPITVYTMAKFIADKKQLYTQFAGVRPYGVSFLIGGIDGGADGGAVRLFETDPAGVLIETKARAIGKDAEKINEMLAKKWKKDIALKEAAGLVVEGLGKEGKLTLSDLVMSVITKEGFRELSEEDLKGLGISG